MKKVLVVMMAVMAMTGLLVVPSFAADKLIVKDAGGTNTVFVVQDTGNTGIGTATPTAPLSIVSSTGVGNLFTITTTSPTGGGGFQFSVPTGGLWNFKATQDNGFKIRDAANNKDVFYVQYATGHVGIGTVTPSHLLHLAGGAYSDGMTWNTASSREFKDNIKELSAAEAVAAVKELNPVTYTYKVDAGEQHVGFIAEDVPALVATKDRKGLSAMDIVAVLTKTVQEQQKIIEKLTEKLSMLEHITDTLTGKNMVSSVKVQ